MIIAGQVWRAASEWIACVAGCQASHVVRGHLNLLFSFHGRLRRLPFLLAVFFTGSFTRMGTILLDQAESTTSRYVFACIVIVGLWSCIALQVKRLHDINLSGWLLLTNLVPVVGPPITFLIAAFKRGKPGPNKFGPEPAAGWFSIRNRSTSVW